LYLYLALFWLILGVLMQFFWDDLQRHAFVRIDRSLAGFVLFVLFSYNFIRWRLSRIMEQHEKTDDEPPDQHRGGGQDYNPELDFSDSKPKEADEKT